MGRSHRLGWSLAGAAALIASPFAAWAGLGSPASSRGAAPSVTRDVAADLEQQLAGVAGAGAGATPSVAFVHGVDLASATAAVRAADLTLVDTFDRIGVAVALGTADQLRAAAARPGVTNVELDAPISFSLDTSHVATRGEEALQGFSVTTSETTTVGRGRQGRGNPQTTTVTTTETSAPVDGSGVTIAVIDSGIDGTHPFFLDADGESKVVRNLKYACAAGVLVPLEGPCIGEQGDAIDELFVDVPANDTDTMSAGGHGTHVAGIAGGGYGTSDGEPLHGAAPGAKLVGLSVGATLSVYGGTAAMNWVLEHHAQPCGPDADAAACPPIRVINNSWSGGGRPYDAEDVTAKIQDELVADGITVVWAAGNDGGDGTTRNIDGPAQSPTGGILSVANYDDGGTGTRDGSLNSSSSRGYEPEISSYPDLSAPGTSILSSCRPTLPICFGDTHTGDGAKEYFELTGTSMAAPHIAGIVAQLLQADPTLTPGEIEDVLEDTAHPFAAGAAYVDDTMNPGTKTSFDKGHGLVDVVAAVSRVRGLSGSPAPVQPCTADGPMLTDPEGDATGALVVESTPLESEPALDVVRAGMGWDGGTLRLLIEVLDLGEAPLTNGSDGESFRSFVDLDSVQYTIDASRDSLGESFGLSGGLAGDSTTLTGTFDPATDLITVVIPADAFVALGGPALADGTVLSGLQVLGRRSLVAVAPPADTANATCPYTLGLGAVPPPAGGGDGGTDPGTDPEPPADVEATVLPGGSFAWSGEPRTDVAVGNNVLGALDASPVGVDTGLTECDLTVAGSCEEHRVFLSVPAGGGTATLTITPTSPGAIDLDVLLLDADGRKIGGAETEAAAETFSVAIPKSGVYTIRLRHYAAVEATYDGLLKLA